MIPFVCTLMLVGALLVLAGWRSPSPSRTRKRLRHGGNPALTVGAGLGCAVAALIVTALPVVAGIAGLVGASLPTMMVRRRERRHALARAQAWPGVLDDVTSAVRAGLDLPEAVLGAGRRAPRDLQPAFGAFEDAYRRNGDFAGALMAMQQVLGDRVFDQLAQALVMAREVGGTDLTQVLRSLGGFIRADLQLRGELLARQSWTVNSARIAVAAPWVVLVMLSARPSTVQAYRSATGAFVLVAVACTSVIAYLTMLRIARLEAVA